MKVHSALPAKLGVATKEGADTGLVADGFYIALVTGVGLHDMGLSWFEELVDHILLLKPLIKFQSVVGLIVPSLLFVKILIRRRHVFFFDIVVQERWQFPKVHNAKATFGLLG